MKILHINFSAKKGGSGIAAYRLHEAMINAGIDSKMLVVDKSPTIPTTDRIYLLERINVIRMSIYNKLEQLILKMFASTSFWALGLWGVDLSKHSLLLEADAIIIHWVNGGMLSIEGVQKVLRLNKPVYWFMHDMWPITGGCHHSFDCTKYVEHCGSCPLLNRFQTKSDISRLIHKKKYDAWHSFKNIHVITPSKWLNECVEKSSIFGEKRNYVCPNVIDTDVYKPYLQDIARRKFDLPVDKKIVLFGADSVYSPYKGWSYLQEALKIVSECNDNVECVILGAAEKKELTEAISLPVHFVGRLNDDESLALLYNAVDVLIVPSLADNFPNVIAESLSCGTPVVGFDIGGIPELVLHKKNGYLAKYKDCNDLANGIQWVLNSTESNLLRDNSRQFALTNLSFGCVEKYYEEILKFIKC